MLCFRMRCFGAFRDIYFVTFRVEREIANAQKIAAIEEFKVF